MCSRFLARWETRALGLLLACCFRHIVTHLCFCLLVMPIAAQTESQRWVEKLHTLYSSGAVVPLPFLRATDAAPLTMLGINQGPPAGGTPAGLQVGYDHTP